MTVSATSECTTGDCDPPDDNVQNAVNVSVLCFVHWTVTWDKLCSHIFAKRKKKPVLAATAES